MRKCKHLPWMIASHNAFRRVDLTAQLSHGVDPHQAIAILKAGLAKIPNVLPDPNPSVEILTFNPLAPSLRFVPSAITRITGKSTSTPTA